MATPHVPIQPRGTLAARYDAAIAAGDRVGAERIAAQAEQFRARVTSRVGLPASASNAQVLAAVDKAVAGRKPKPTPLDAQRASEDALYELAFGHEERGEAAPAAQASGTSSDEDALYALAFGDDA